LCVFFLFFDHTVYIFVESSNRDNFIDKNKKN